MASLYYLSGLIFIINIIKIFQLCSVFLESWTICQQLQHSHPFPSGIHQHVEQQWQHEDLPGQSQTMCAVGPCDLWTHSSSQQGQTTEEFFRYCSSFHLFQVDLVHVLPGDGLNTSFWMSETLTDFTFWSIGSYLITFSIWNQNLFLLKLA